MRKILWLILFLTIPTLVSAQKMTIRYHDGRPDRTTTMASVDASVYLPISTVSEIFSAAKYWRQESRQMALHIDNHQFVLMVNNPIVSVDQTLWNLPAPVLYRGGTIWVPLPFVDTVIDSFIPETIDWDPELNVLTLAVAPARENIVGMEFTADYQETRVIIETAEPMRFRTQKPMPGNLTVIIEGGHARAQNFTEPYTHGFIEAVAATNHPDHFTLNFEYNRNAKSYHIESFENPPRIELKFLGYDVNETPEPPQIRERRDDKPSTIVSDLDLIVIDPGHGGKDPGAVGPDGTHEKEIVLDIALRLSEMIQNELGIRTFLTRDDDTFIPLRKRTEMANSMQADLFISIHCNASPSRSANGTETYFLSLAKTNEARAVAARENASLKYEMPPEAIETMGDLDFILWDLAQYEYLEESSTLAEITQEEMGKRLNITSRRVNQAPFYVLNGAYMPAILVETAFITNKHEERLLNTPAFRQNVAEAVTAAVARYKQHYDSKMAHTN